MKNPHPFSDTEATQLLEYLLATSAVVDLLAREPNDNPEVEAAMIRWQEALFELPASLRGNDTWLAVTAVYAAAAGPFETLAPG